MAKKTGSTSISFRTKGGKEIAFKAKGTNAKKRQVHVKQIEKRLSAMEKAVMQYNNAVQTAKTTKAVGGESGERAVGKSGKQENKPAKGKTADQTVGRAGKGKEVVAEKA
jgi:hypothetical protein